MNPFSDAFLLSIPAYTSYRLLVSKLQNIQPDKSSGISLSGLRRCGYFYGTEIRFFRKTTSVCNREGGRCFVIEQILCQTGYDG
ncbi:hypothetical protein CDL62_09605 [Alkalitalea saponilacus]|nr:hypothetical protein CDL62_09605 [Alkalitalea saponilacus]